MDIIHTFLELLKVWVTIFSDGIDSLNDNSRVITVIFAFIVVIVPVIYAILTWRLISETQKLREAQTELQNLIHKNKHAFVATQPEYEKEEEGEEQQEEGER
jgi:predicted PurR-regulated permease PerM